MRKLFLFMMVTTDGYFEGVDHDISWHNAANEEFNEFALKNLVGTDAIVMGHRTYNLMASYWPSEDAVKNDTETAAFMTNTQKYIAAHEDFDPGWANVEVMTDPVAKIKELKELHGGELALLGSNELCVSLMEAGLVDEFRIMYNPTALGSGTSLFTGLTKRIDFTVQSVRTFESGNTLVVYRLL